MRIKAVPIHLPTDVLDITQSASHLHNPVPNHSRVETECSSHRVLRYGAGVEAEDEVVALVVLSSLFAGDGRKHKGTPIRDAADYSSGCEDDVPGCAYNSDRGKCLVRKWGWEESGMYGVDLGRTL